MRKYLVAAIVALLANTAIAQSSADLVHLSAKDVPEEKGKKLEMSFHEIKRAPDNSVVEVTNASGSSEASSMFILRGMCSIAQSRGQQYFRAVQVSKQPVRFGVTFPKEAENSAVKADNVTDKVYSLAECALLKF